MRKAHLLVFGLAWLAAGMLVGGCPLGGGLDDDELLVARITISATGGLPPLRVTVSAADSEALDGEIVEYRWDFAGEATATSVDASHTFTTPGRHTILLTIRDSMGREATARQDVRIQGSGATAVITADRTSGPAPLGIQFDGTASSAPDDTILDYFWDFGDGGSSRAARPFYLYENEGEFTVTLRVVTSGGVEATAEETISVGAAGGSLQFNGSQYATLSLAAGQTFSSLTFEGWARPQGAGGTVVMFGSPAVTVAVLPGESAVRVSIGGSQVDVAASNLANVWSHVAVSYSSADGATIYINGVQAGTLAASGDVTVNQLILGNSFVGNISNVRLWSTVRSGEQIAANRSAQLSGSADGLEGSWPLDDGSGQEIENLSGGPAGVRGSSSATESIDPAWNSDAP